MVVEIGVRGDGLTWVTGQGDLSAGGISWFALDANAAPEHNLALLQEVAGRRLEPRFAAEIDWMISEYEGRNR